MPLNLFFLRHAIAVERGTKEFTEAERPLTASGREKMTLAVRGMRRLGIRFEALLSSPLVRAVQTAELVKSHLPFKGSVEIEKDLEPGASLKSLLKKLGDRRENGIMVVGHEPTLSWWIQSLLGFGSSATLSLKKGALCQLILESPALGAPAQLVALLQPRVLRRLGRKAG